MNTKGWTPGFSRFYAAYPEGYQRQTCARLWVTMGLEADVERIIAGLEVWKLCAQWRGGVINGMRSFLEERLWEQTPPGAKGKAPAPVGGTLDKWAGVKGGRVDG